MAEGLTGRIGVVTGASSGIGAAVARELAAAGMALVLGARRAERLAQVCAEIVVGGGRADWLVTDIRDERQVEALVGAAIERHGQIDVLVNNAALGTLGTIAEGRTPEWRAILETNVLGPAIACRAALRHMLPRGRGDIVNVSSAAARDGWPYLGLYAASKAGLAALSRALRAEVAPHGLRVMTIEIHNVGGTDFAASFDPALLPAAIARWQELGLLARAAPLIEPGDVARAIAFQLAQREPASVHELVIRSRGN
jgi:NADP-dependent 3-hydroxy acid dehydrogenase YdfG